MTRHPAPAPAPRSTRWLAALLAVMVWALGVFGASPDLHAALHGHGEADAHECAVTLFAHGADALGAAPEITLASAERELGRVAPALSHEWTAPEHRLRPACGPPRR